MPFAFDPYTEEFVRDPYPTYHAMRSVEPISYQPHWNLTFFTRHEDVSRLLRDRRLGRDIVQALGDPDIDHREVPRAYPNWRRYVRRLAFLEREPPDHTRLRRLVSKAFTRGRVEALRPSLTARAEALLDRVEDRGAFELVADYATPIPLHAIADLLGIPHRDRHRLIPWSHDIVGLYELSPTPETGARAERATIEFVAYLRALVAERHRQPRDDLLSALVAVEEEGDRLSEDELVATAILLLNAGHEATVHAISNGVLALLRHRDCLARLVAEPHLIPTAAEELLRYDTPLQLFERWVLEDIRWRGHPLQAGTKIAFLMAAANRDPARFPDPDVLDLARADNPHVSFGGGIHHCLGMALGRLELEVAYEVLFRRFPDLELAAAEPPRRPSVIFRGVTELPVAF